MKYIVILAIIVVPALWFRHQTFNKIADLIASLEELEIQLQAAVRSGDFSSLEMITQHSQEINRSYPFLAKFGDFKNVRREYLNHYDHFINQLNSVYKELEIQSRVNNLNK
ncbi:hypothetical protein NRIC_09370 [Enterococcus florum]|uniref:Uncharacterized protein n=1 Tax=Enterococcus florum TaxID=2480627 RepID=A0A4P5P6L2_9ENTE|nr:hypothetical protein [Enterococcus florum]GCF93046.1 hypothetical protein NRIC_09370 [Enterococcus florum]